MGLCLGKEAPCGGSFQEMEDWSGEQKLDTYQLTLYR